MFGHRWDKNKKRPYKKGDGNYSFKNLQQSYDLTPEQVAELMLNRPELRLQDHPANIELAQILTATKEDSSIQELFQLVYHDGLGRAIVTQDEFLGSYPAKGSVVATPDMICCGHMPTGDGIFFNHNRLFCNLGVFGRTGSGKTSWLYPLIKQILKTGFQC